MSTPNVICILLEIIYFFSSFLIYLTILVASVLFARYLLLYTKRSLRLLTPPPPAVHHVYHSQLFCPGHPKTSNSKRNNTSQRNNENKTDTRLRIYRAREPFQRQTTLLAPRQLTGWSIAHSTSPRQKTIKFHATNPIETRTKHTKTIQDNGSSSTMDAAAKTPRRRLGSCSRGSHNSRHLNRCTAEIRQAKDRGTIELSLFFPQL